MSLFANPTEHTANPPNTWVVVKRGERSWSLCSAAGHEFSRHERKRDAQNARVDSWATRLYYKESCWYAGQSIPGWRPYSAILSVGQS